MKNDFFLPAIIFVVAVGLIAAYMFAVQNGYAVSRLIDTAYSEVYLGLVVNNGNATDGLIVANGRTTLGSPTPGTNTLNVAGTISATEMKIGTQNVCRADGTNCQTVTEADTLDSVTDRGSTTTNSITVGSATINGILGVGYEIVSVNSGSNSSATAICPGSKYVIGGGCSGNMSFSLLYSYPSNQRRWQCNYISTAYNITAYAICANVGP